MEAVVTSQYWYRYDEAMMLTRDEERIRSDMQRSRSERSWRMAEVRRYKGSGGSRSGHKGADTTTVTKPVRRALAKELRRGCGG